MRRLRFAQSKAPLAVAGLLAAPIFFASLMAASLAYDRPHMIGKTERPPTNATEAAVWGLAAIPPAILLLVGVLALPLGRWGLYVAAVAGIVVCVLLPIRLDAWGARHAHRFPEGIDLVVDSSASNASSRGEWESSAEETARGIAHWTIAIAVGAMVVAALGELRRRRGAPPLQVDDRLAELAATGGAPPQV